MELKYLFTDKIRKLSDKIPFVSPESIERELGTKFLLRVGANESNFGASPKVVLAMQNAAKLIHQYSDPEAVELRELLGEKFGMSVKSIALGSGIDDLLGLFVRLFVGSREKVVTSLGCYPTFNYHVSGYGGDLHMVPYVCDKEDLVGLADAAYSENAKMVYLANPDNPMGTWHEKEALEEFVNKIPPTCILLIDEAYADFAPTNAILNPNTTPKNVIHLRTFSKAYGMAGARIGYALCHEDICLGLDKIRNHFGVNRIAQAGAIATFSDEFYVYEVLKEVAQGKKFYENLAHDLGFTAIKSATNFIAMDTGSKERARELSSELTKRRVFVRMPSVSPLDRCIRITIGPKDECYMVAEAIRSSMSGIMK